MQDTQTEEFWTFALCNCFLTSSWVTVRVESVSPSWQECFIWPSPKYRREIFIAFPSCPATHRPTVPSLYHTCSHAGSCPQPVLLLPWGTWSSEWCHHFPASLCIQWSARQTPAACLFSCPVPKQQCAHRCLLFKQAKHNILFVFLTNRSFKWMSLSLYSGSEVCEVWGKKQLKR